MTNTRGKNSGNYCKRLFRLLLLTLPLLCLSGCTTKIIYNYLDTALLWELGHYIDLSREQKKQSKRALQDFHQWHRSTQLSLYANHLRDLQRRIIKGDLNAEKLAIEHQQVHDLLNPSLMELANKSIAILPSLTDKQIVALKKALDADRKKYHKKYIKPSHEKRKKIRAKQLKKALKRFIGRLNEKQQEEIALWSERLKPYEQVYYEQQDIWSTQLITVLEKRKDKIQLKKEIIDLFIYPEKFWSEEFQTLIRHNQKQSYIMFANILKYASKDQKEKLLRRIESYANDFEDLATVANQ